MIAVVTTTGTGWVDDPVADSLEAIWGGNSAIVATQYSYLPSWLSFLFDGPRAEDAGRSLIDAVHARIQAIPPGQPRPRMIVFGESLGSQGSEAAFSSLADVRAGTDGVLWVGPPNSNRLWSQIVARRDPGSPEIRPVYSDGLVVRFAGGPDRAYRDADPGHAVDRRRTCCTCSTRRTRWCGGPRTCSGTGPTGWWSPEATTSSAR